MLNCCCTGITNNLAEFPSRLLQILTYHQRSCQLPPLRLSCSIFLILHFARLLVEGSTIIAGAGEPNRVCTRVHSVSINTFGGKVGAPDLILSGITALLWPPAPILSHPTRVTEVALQDVYSVQWLGGYSDIANCCNYPSIVIFIISKTNVIESIIDITSSDQLFSRHRSHGSATPPPVSYIHGRPGCCWLLVDCSELTEYNSAARGNLDTF